MYCVPSLRWPVENPALLRPAAFWSMKPTVMSRGLTPRSDAVNVVDPAPPAWPPAALAPVAEAAPPESVPPVPPDADDPTAPAPPAPSGPDPATPPVDSL